MKKKSGPLRYVIISRLHKFDVKVICKLYFKKCIRLKKMYKIKKDKKLKHDCEVWR